MVTFAEMFLPLTAAIGWVAVGLLAGKLASKLFGAGGYAYGLLIAIGNGWCVADGLDQTLVLLCQLRTKGTSDGLGETRGH